MLGEIEGKGAEGRGFAEAIAFQFAQPCPQPRLHAYLSADPPPALQKTLNQLNCGKDTGYSPRGTMGDDHKQLPEKPDFLSWIETWLPFRLPRIPLVQTAKNLDRAAAAIVLACGDNAVARIETSTTRIESRSAAEKTFIEFGT